MHNDGVVGNVWEGIYDGGDLVLDVFLKENALRHFALVAGVFAVAMVVMGTEVRAAGLGRTMGDMEKAFKALGTDTADLTKNDAALKDVSALEAASLLAKDMVPPKVRKMEAGADKDKALAAYRKMIGELIKVEMDLDGAIVDKDADGVKKEMGTIMEVMKKGHDAFQE